jgi:hypothetical protein
VLPRDPLEVLHLEEEERQDPEEDGGVGHEGRVLSDFGHNVNPTFGQIWVFAEAAVGRAGYGYPR